MTLAKNDVGEKTCGKKKNMTQVCTDTGCIEAKFHQISQPNTRSKPIDEIYQMYSPLHLWNPKWKKAWKKRPRARHQNILMKSAYVQLNFESLRFRNRETVHFAFCMLAYRCGKRENVRRAESVWGWTQNSCRTSELFDIRKILSNLLVHLYTLTSFSIYLNNSQRCSWFILILNTVEYWIVLTFI